MITKQLSSLLLYYGSQYVNSFPTFSLILSRFLTSLRIISLHHYSPSIVSAFLGFGTSVVCLSFGTAGHFGLTLWSVASGRRSVQLPAIAIYELFMSSSSSFDNMMQTTLRSSAKFSSSSGSNSNKAAAVASAFLAHHPARTKGKMTLSLAFTGRALHQQRQQVPISTKLTLARNSLTDVDAIETGTFYTFSTQQVDAEFTHRRHGPHLAAC
jgi:hypothetical protein